MEYLDDREKKLLALRAKNVRISIIEMLAEAGSGHTAGSLGMVDIFVALYFKVANVSPENAGNPERDRIILSNGHIVPVRYATMAEAGFFDKKELFTLRKFGSRLQGHPERTRMPELETTSGPLGEGLSQACGMALGLRSDYGLKSPFVYCLMSDGEMNAGNIWEAGLFASKYGLGNLIGVIDRNNIQINGNTEDVMPLEPLFDKWKSFGWHVIEIDGHNYDHIVGSLLEAKAITYAPTMIIANTIPGKGVSAIEGDYRWHGVPPGKGPDDVVAKESQREEFIKQIKEYYGE